MGPVAQFAAAAGVVLAGTVIAVLLYQLVDLTRLAIFFLGSVIVCALLFGRRPGVFAAFLAFAAYNFSLVEPRFTFRLVGADDLLTLAVFLIVALSIGGLAGRVRDSERQARMRAQETDALLEASRAFGDAVDVEAVAIELCARLRAVVEGAADVADAPAPAGWRSRPLSLEPGSPVAAWRLSAEGPDAARQDRLCSLMIDLASAAVNRIHLVDTRTDLEAEARAGRLRDAILGSISHDLRTPLATVLASASSLQEYGDRFDLKTRADLAGVIVHEADRLNRYVERLLDLSRIEAGQVAPRLEPTSLSEIVDAVVRRLPAPGGSVVQADDLDSAPFVLADGRLLEQAMFNLLDNALIHGGEGVRVDVRAESKADMVTVVIEDDGAGVEDDELADLGRKFHRGRRPGNASTGAGMGLAVVKGFVEAMGGTLQFTRGEARRGLRVGVTLRTASAR
ncbi:MAG: DUF4118 domain-containing protein [Caulobacteraceae bacterium]|nr:DUF4118 domain-containing protein [Caulobacteraceae bacterium]